MSSFYGVSENANYVKVNSENIYHCIHGPAVVDVNDKRRISLHYSEGELSNPFGPAIVYEDFENQLTTNLWFDKNKFVSSSVHSMLCDYSNFEATKYLLCFFGGLFAGIVISRFFHL